MKIALAQINSITGNIEANIALHRQWIDIAITSKVDLIVFPELSITGYQPTLAKELAINKNDQRFSVFQNYSDLNNITIAIGTPSVTKNGIAISMLIFQPKLPRTLYSKQHLHKDEFPYFTNGSTQLILNIKGIKIAPAICYESLQHKHSDNASKLGADIYITSVAKSKEGVEKAITHYPIIATKHKMTVLMVNSTGYSDNFMNYGNSSAWNIKGNLIGNLDNKNQGMLFYNSENNNIVIQNIKDL